MNAKHDSHVIVRFPPSPTGYVHIGNVRTLLFSYLFAKKHGGRIIFRSEDTDRARSKREYESANLDDLAWLGLSWDEFHRQSERKDIHQTYLEKLVGEGKAYLSKEESKLTPGETAEVVRLKNPGKIITFVDEIRGEITFDTTELGDIVIARAIDDPVYHFAVVADDSDMGVTHIIRGEEHISNTPRQILIQEAIGAPRPVYAHLPIILAPDRKKLSKRHGATSLHEYRETGYLKEALTNFLALIGWSPGTDEEFFTLPELVERFDFGGIQKSAGVFNIDKLLWFNREYVKKIPETDFKALAAHRLPERITSLLSEVEHAGRFERLLPTIQDRTTILADISRDAEAGEYDFAFFAPNPPTATLAWKKDPSPTVVLPRLEKLAGIIGALPSFPTADEAKEAVWEYAEQEGRGEVLWPLRVALSGREKSPDPFTLIYILGRDEALRRIAAARAALVV
ncbi:glutamate--tRNA ligase [Candidatus Kaiserbacteria bacterium]|nr:glutamate--tRNA ligase [Candidatus Kaiserbacteria bacterium]